MNISQRKQTLKRPKVSSKLAKSTFHFSVLGDLTEDTGPATGNQSRITRADPCAAYVLPGSVLVSRLALLYNFYKQDPANLLKSEHARVLHIQYTAL